MTDTPEVQAPEIKHHGLHRHRLALPCHQTNQEQIFADEWEKSQRDGTLVVLVTSRKEPGAVSPWSFNGDWITHPEELTQRDADVAATVVQWLGTNVGFCWLEETLRKIGYKLTRQEPADRGPQEGA